MKKMLMGRTGPELTSGNACWETPPLVYEAIAGTFGPFDLDLTADAWRTLCPRWLGPGSSLGADALEVAWHQHGASGFSNPPFGPFVPKMLEKAAREARLGFTSTLLLPVRITQAFHKIILAHASALYFCDRRLTFFENGVPRLNAEALRKGRAVADSAMFDCMIVRFGPGTAPIRVGGFTVPPHVFHDDLERAMARLDSRGGVL